MKLFTLIFVLSLSSLVLADDVANSVKYYSTTTTIKDRGTYVRNGYLMELDDGGRKIETFGWNHLYIGDAVSFVYMSQEIRGATTFSDRNLELKLDGFIQKDGAIKRSSEDYHFIQSFTPEKLEIDVDSAIGLAMTKKISTAANGSMLVDIFTHFTATDRYPANTRKMVTTRKPITQQEFLAGAPLAVGNFVAILVTKHHSALKAEIEYEKCLKTKPTSQCLGLKKKYESADVDRDSYLHDTLSETDVSQLQPTDVQYSGEGGGTRGCSGFFVGSDGFLYRCN